jgi:hypothetical protein
MPDWEKRLKTDVKRKNEKRRKGFFIIVKDE